MLTKSDKAGIAAAVCAWFGLIWYIGTHRRERRAKICALAFVAICLIGIALGY